MNLKSVEERDIIEIPLESNSIIKGIYFRNGPNSNDYDKKSHLFDGNGMIHYIKFENDKIIYGNKHVQTNRLKYETKYKKSLFDNMGSLNLKTILTKFIQRLLNNADPLLKNGSGTANTSVIMHANKIFALHEGDFPYELKYNYITNQLETIGRINFDNKLKHNINAHPKIDIENGDLIVLGYNFIKNPYCKISFINNIGNLYKTVNINLDEPTMIHEIGITKDYVVILDLAIKFSFKKLITFKYPIYTSKKTSKLGFLNKNTSKINWCNLDKPTIIFHIANCWQENNVLILYAICYNENTFDIFDLDEQKPFLTRFEICLVDFKLLKREIVNNIPGEFPVVDDSKIGLPTKNIFYSKISKNGFSGIVKYNVDEQSNKVLDFEQGLYCGENQIINDKYILSIIYNSHSQKSEIHVFDFDFNIILKVNLPINIPFGFHGLFLN